MIDAEITGIILILIGLYGIITKSNLIKQILSLNILSIGVVLFFVGTGYVKGADIPIMPRAKVVDPLPATLMLTTLVVDVAITALALALILRIRGEEK